MTQPVCVLGLGLIGGSVVRAARAAGREVFGYNRSIDGVEAARFDGFDATDRVSDALERAAATDALIVLAVPMPALPIMLDHIRTLAPTNPLTDGALGEIRTPGPRVRSPLLYPAELQAQMT